MIDRRNDRMRASRRVMTMMLVTAAILGAASDAAAQLKGHYVPGFTGLQNGSQGPPALTFVLPVYFYTTDTLKDDNGETLGAHPRINATFLGPGLLWVTNVEVLGARLGGQVLPIAFMKSRLEGPSLDVPGSFKFTDIYVQPVQLGWDRPRADFVAGWGFFAPTGSWELGADDNGGLGMWSNLFQVGSTIRLDNRRAWSTSVLSTYEIHSDKRDTDIRVGNIWTLEGSLGHSFYKKLDGTPIPRITTLGLVYYTQVKATADSAVLFDEQLQRRKDHVFGIGAEGNVFLPKQKLLLGFRWVPEFGAVNRTQGHTFVLTMAYQAKSLVKAP